MAKADQFDLEKVPGTGKTVREVMPAFRKELRASRKWKHPALERKAKAQGKKVELLAKKQQLAKLMKALSEWSAIENDADYIPAIEKEFERIDPVIKALKKSAPKKHAQATSRMKGAKSYFDAADFLKCMSELSILKSELPGGPNYKPVKKMVDHNKAERKTSKGKPLAPQYKRAKTRLEAVIKKALADQSGKFDRFKAESECVAAFFKTHAKLALHKKLAEIDKKPPGDDRKRLIGKAILVLQNYISGYKKAVKDKSAAAGESTKLSSEYDHCLRQTHRELKKRYSAA